MTILSISKNTRVAPARAEVLKAALAALSLGFALVYVAGFAWSDTAHNAAHDTRHSLSFPCH